MPSTEQSSLAKRAVLWGTILILIQLSMATPLAVFTIWFAAVPAVLLYVKTNVKWFAAIAGAAVVLGSILYGTFAPLYLMMALITMAPAAAMGEAYRRKKNARKAITTGVVAYLAVYLLLILLATLLGVNLTTEISKSIRETIDQFIVESVRSAITEDALRQFIELNVMMIPFYLIASSTLLAAVTHTVSRRLANRTEGTKLPKLPPMRDWKLPRSFVWYYLIALFAELFIPVDRSSFLSTIVVNMVPIFMLIFVVQGLAFLFFIGYTKRRMWIPWVGLAAVIVINPLFMPFSLLGVFDTAFPIRDRFRKP